MPAEHIEVRLESNAFSCDGVQIHRLAGREAISQLYELDLTIVVTEPGEIDPDEVAGAEVDIVFVLAGEELRRIHGMVSTIDDLLDSEPMFRTYRLRVHPRAHRLTLVETQDIFLNT